MFKGNLFSKTFHKNWKEVGALKPKIISKPLGKSPNIKKGESMAFDHTPLTPGGSKEKPNVKITHLTTHTIYFKFLSSLLSLDFFNMLVHRDICFPWFQRMTWVKQTLFYVFHLTSHPSRSRVHLETQLHQASLIYQSSKDLRLYEMQIFFLLNFQLCPKSCPILLLTQAIFNLYWLAQ